VNIYTIYGIFSQLKNNSAKSAKEAILKTHKDNNDFLEVLKFLYDPFIVTGLSTKKINKQIDKTMHLKESDRPSDLKGLIDYLKTNNSGRDYDVIVVNAFCDTFEEMEIQDFIKEIATKDFKCGITEKTINKVYGKGTIPSFGVMLAESYAKKEAKVKGKFYITLKLDGNRCTAIKEDDEVKFFTRKGQPIDGMSQLESQLRPFPDGVYDGEVLLVNDDNLSSADLFRATQKVVRKDGEKKNLDFHIFDNVTLAEFKEGKSTRTYEQRRNTLDILAQSVDAMLQPFASFEAVCPNIHVLPVLYAGEDKQMISRLMLWAEEAGHEGLMVNTADGLYVTKRTDALLKVKTMKTADLLVMSVEKAIDGQFKGLLSRVNVEYKGNLVGVGSGFTLEQREEFINNTDLIAGKIIEVQFFEESKDEKTGQPSLRFPVFKGIRYDKGVEDIRYE
jgi:DNA ligase-1